MDTDDLLDLDSTSQTHIYRALKRAEVDYGCFRPCLVKKMEQRSGKLGDDEGNAYEVPQSIARIACYDYTNLISQSRLITCKEIHSSVSRSRRWAGKEHPSNSTTNVSKPRCSHRSVDSKLAPQTAPDSKLTPQTAPIYFRKKPNNDNNSPQRKLSVERDYHQTICNILASKGATSSYAHVAKVLDRKSPSARVSVSKSAACTARKSRSLPSLLGSKPENLSRSSAKKLVDITLPSVTSNDSTFSTNDNSKLVNNKNKSNFRPELDVFYRGPRNSLAISLEKLNMTNLHDATLDDLQTGANLQPPQSRLSEVSKKQARRTIASYYNKKPEQDCDSKVVVIHLPNPNTALEKMHLQKNTPKLLLRNVSLFKLKTHKTKINLTPQLTQIPSTSRCLTPINPSRINIRPFLEN